MYGNNPSERKREGHDGNSLDVVEVFPTLQGEGPHAGVPATFVRLAGCHLRCTFCDTDFTSTRRDTPLQELLDHVKSLGHVLVVITGGEPLRQNIVPLAMSLRASGHVVQVETAGHFWWPEAETVMQIVVSPKTAVVHHMVHRYALAWKYIIGHDEAVSDEDGLPLRSTQPGEKFKQRLARPPKELMSLARDRVFIQPCDHQDAMLNEKSLALAMYICFEHGYRLSLQQHKILRLP